MYKKHLQHCRWIAAIHIDLDVCEYRMLLLSLVVEQRDQVVARNSLHVQVILIEVVAVLRLLDGKRYLTFSWKRLLLRNIEKKGMCVKERERAESREQKRCGWVQVVVCACGWKSSV